MTYCSEHGASEDVCMACLQPEIDVLRAQVAELTVQLDEWRRPRLECGGCAGLTERLAETEAALERLRGAVVSMADIDWNCRRIMWRGYRDRPEGSIARLLDALDATDPEHRGEALRAYGEEVVRATIDHVHHCCTDWGGPGLDTAAGERLNPEVCVAAVLGDIREVVPLGLVLAGLSDDSKDEGVS